MIENNQRLITCLELLKKKIESKEFKDDLSKMHKIDANHYSKFIQNQNLLSAIENIKNKEFEAPKYKDVLVLTVGNPDIIFNTMLEALRCRVNLTIIIQDFCLAQNMFLVKIFKDILEKQKLNLVFDIKNNLKDKEIINESKGFEKVICIGDSNLFNRLANVINLTLYPYGIFEIYTNSEKFSELKETIYKVLETEEFEVEEFDDLVLEDALRLINKTGYGFCTLLLSDDNTIINEFKNNIKTKHLIINKNPFSEIKFDLNINE